jgi:hypothetical protein
VPAERIAASSLALALAGSCVAPSVLDESRRAVAPAGEAVAWREPVESDFRGLFESASIEGEVAGALAKVWYHFAGDGTYSGAALVIGGDAPEFQTLSGRWSLAGDRLDLGDGQLAAVRVAEGRLRLESEGGIAVLRAVEVR